MKLKAGYKYSLCLALTVMAAALCALPFFMVKKETVYVYTKSITPDSKERGFIAELKRQNFAVKENPASLPPKDAVGFWFKPPSHVAEIAASTAEYNFLYSEEYYPAEWRGLKKLPVLLTPYRDLYEHYVRSNLKTALFTLGVNPADYYAMPAAKEYPVLYYGDNNKPSPPEELLSGNIKILGNFWENSKNLLSASNEDDRAKAQALRKSLIVVVYNKVGTGGAQKIPSEVIEAAASGALVLSSENPAVTEVYGDSVVIYNKAQDLLPIISHYRSNQEIAEQKIIAAQKITAQQLNSAASAKRFIELLAWLKNNSKK